MLAEKALLVHVNIQIWTARVRDHNAAARLEKNEGAEEGLGVYVKTLVSKQAVNKIGAVVKAARRAIDDKTLPWGDDGTRLLPAENWGAFEEELARRQEKFYAAVDEFMQGYEEHRRALSRKRLGGLYNSKDFKPEETVRKRFKFKVDYRPFPNEADVRLSLSHDEIKDIEQKVRSSVDENVARAMRDVFFRLHEAAETLQVQLSKPDGKIAYQTHGLLKKLADILPSLNLRNDPRLEKAADKLREEIVTYDRHELQDKPQARKKAAAAAKQVVTLMNQAIAEANKKIDD